MSKLGKATDSAGRAIWNARAELLTTIAGILAWVFLTAAIAEIAPPRIVWRASAGFLFLSLFGWQFFYEIARRGLYVLTRAKR